MSNIDLSSFEAHYARRVIPVLVCEGDLVCVIGVRYFMVELYVILWWKLFIGFVYIW